MTTGYQSPKRPTSAGNKHFLVDEFGGNSIVGAPANLKIFDKESGQVIGTFERDISTSAEKILTKLEGYNSPEVAVQKVAKYFGLTPIVEKTAEVEQKDSTTSITVSRALQLVN